MRIFVGFLVAALALGGAVWLHNAELDPALCRGVVPGDANAEVDCNTSSGRPSGFRVEHPARKTDW